jgi:hypothetical protein
MNDSTTAMLTKSTLSFCCQIGTDMDVLLTDNVILVKPGLGQVCLANL